MRHPLAHPLVLALAVLLLAAGLAPYAVFAGHVLARGDAVIRETWDSDSARGPLVFAGIGLASFAASGLAGLAALRGSRWQPLAGLGIPLAVAGAVGLLAFEAGPGVFWAGATVLACYVAAAVAAVAVARPEGAWWRVALGSWLTVGALLTLALMAFGALGVLEKQLPSIPWSSLLAALALATLMRSLARHVARTGQDPSPVARHEQVRTGLEDDGIRAVAGRLHPFVEEGRGGAGYDALAADLAQRTGTQLARRAPPAPGPTLPAPAMALAALLRALALCAPVAFLLPGLWALAVPLTLLGLLLPATRATLLPRREPLRAAWWLLGAALAGGGGALCAWLALGDPALAAVGAALALPYIGVALWAGRRALPEEVAFLRAGKARALAERRTVQVVQGALVAAAFLLLPLALAGLPLLIGVALPQAPPLVVVAGATGGALWMLAALVAGSAARRSLASLESAHEKGQAARRAAHRTLLDSLEAS